MEGLFKPKNFKKYLGNPTNIIYRSSWELKLMREFDADPNVLSWGSETIIIPYRSPVDNKIHRYYVDFIVTKLLPNGKKQTSLIEVKPYKQTKPPVKGNKKRKTFLTEVNAWGVNKAKWEQADNYCKDRGWKFEIYTEKTLNIPVWKK